MAKQVPSLTEDHCRFITEQHLFFTGPAAPDGRVNLSKWTEAKPDMELRAYWLDKNVRTIVGKPTGVPIP